ncbi:MAG: cold shock domain-containing protein [Nanoarchaeota archaeon]
MKGKVKFFNVSKGFGFVAGEDGKEYFVHQTALKPGTRLHENDSVSFDVVQGDRGPKASNVAMAAAGASEASDDAPAADESSEDNFDGDSDDEADADEDVD